MLHPNAGFTGEAWVSTAATKAVSLIHLNIVVSFARR